jgi:hypothetical protein
MKKLLIILLFIPLFCQAQLPDRSLHYAGGTFCGAWGTWVGSIYFEASPEKSALIGLGITALATGGKELIDYGTGGKVEMRDLGNSMFGGFVGAGLVYMGMKIFQSNVPYFTFNNGLQIGIKLRI